MLRKCCLKEASGRGLGVMHGVFVYEIRAAFYQYDRERQIVLPEPQGQVQPFDMHLTTERGAVRFLGIAEDVKQMRREFIHDLEVPTNLHIQDPDPWYYSLHPLFFTC